MDMVLSSFTMTSAKPFYDVVSHNLQSSVHINIIVAKAQRANAILRCIKSRDTNLLVRAFNV